MEVPIVHYRTTIRRCFVLSMNRPTPSEDGCRRSSASCQFPSWEGLGVGSWSQCTALKSCGLSMNHSTQIRMTNDKIRMTKPATAQLRVFDIRAWVFFRQSSFVIVIQRFLQVRFMVPLHAEERKAALHEPTQPRPPRTSPRSG